MRSTLTVLLVFALTGCALSPPKPPAVQGDYRPVNRAMPVTKHSAAAAKIFDFKFEGDIVAALNALHDVQPRLLVLEPEGIRTPVTVKVDLHGATLEQALRAIGEQGGNDAELVWNPATAEGGDQTFIRFRSNISARGAE